jgi:regulation of enolase protein 1 (concanavalin A-like superfamily)
VDEEFADSAALGRWTWFHDAERWPDMRRRTAVRTAGTGELYLEPHTSGWYADFHGPFLYRLVAGDFVATARVLAEAPDGGVPRIPWSLGGLMVRAPRAVDSATWTPGGEQWLFITAGVADQPSRPVLETKTTVGSRSALRLHPVRAGWVELRVTRTGPAFELASRQDGEEWVTRARFDRPELPDTLQVGINAYTDWYHASALHDDPRRFNATVLHDGNAGLGLRVDWVRVIRPPAGPGRAP